ncbi:MAG: chromophore lyase CpcT/CpeT [Phycisphaerales bacterium]|nr:chromophore lyase CpcT/CpeT [Phycisphaerales bacterium]
MKRAAIGGVLAAGLWCGQAWAEPTGKGAEPAPAKPSAAKAPDLDDLLARMTGSFTSRGQAQDDPEHYMDIRLRMVRIWPDRADGPWLYVEQAVGVMQKRPYRQRVYRLSEMPDGRLKSEVYTLPGDALAFAGAWKQEKPLADLTPDKLTLKEGCALVLSRQPDGTFKGSTDGKGCPSDLRGATYATSEAQIFDDHMVTWDRGWDSEGKQVWGAEKGGYRFVKLKPGEADPEPLPPPARPAPKTDEPKPVTNAPAPRPRAPVDHPPEGTAPKAPPR